jgi:hypothetical protein
MSKQTKLLKLFFVTLFTVPAIFIVLYLTLFAVIGGDYIIALGGGTIIMPAPIMNHEDPKNILGILGQAFVVLTIQFGWMYLIAYMSFCWLFATVSIFQKEILSICRDISNTRIFLVIRKRRGSL